ncbi:hypothetical protein DFH09DRAFT_1086077 [Mycena vulgaris]|nr:hypothetical protein DFH09DRAFT_1086077 [Mycena vulgaris]
MSSSPSLEASLIPGTLCACVTILLYDWLCTLDQEASTLPATHPLNSAPVYADPQSRPDRLGTDPKPVAKLMRISPECTGIPATLFMQLELASLDYPDVPTDGVGCKLAEASTIVIFAYIMLMISETTIVVMTAIKAYRGLRRSRQPWLAQLYHDGEVLRYTHVQCGPDTARHALLRVPTGHIPREHFGPNSGSSYPRFLTVDVFELVGNRRNEKPAWVDPEGAAGVPGTG